MYLTIFGGAHLPDSIWGTRCCAWAAARFAVAPALQRQQAANNFQNCMGRPKTVLNRAETAFK
eukprot:9494486-Alexandrium_andersonii.AAC.1